MWGGGVTVLERVSVGEMFVSVWKEVFVDVKKCVFVCVCRGCLYVCGWDLCVCVCVCLYLCVLLMYVCVIVKICVLMHAYL